MSNQYIQRLRAIRDEYEAARQGIAYVNTHWDRYDIYRETEMKELTPKNFQRAARYLLSTYLLRLTAEFEGILKSHLQTNHPSLSIPQNPKIDQLISKVSRAEEFSVDPTLRTNLAAVRDYRNQFVHSGEIPPTTVEFTKALAWFNTFLARLPDPLS